ncbi:MAG: DUF2332 family protein [Rhodobacterales bacterium]
MILSELGASAGLNPQLDQFYIAVGAGYGPADSTVVLRPEWSGTLPLKAVCRMHRALILRLWISNSQTTYCACEPISGRINLRGSGIRRPL